VLDPQLKGIDAFIEKLFDHQNLRLCIAHKALDGWLAGMAKNPTSSICRESSSNCHETRPTKLQGQA